ncbi:MAG: purine-binding chemotaxis protein CheW, partial [Candidatus Kapabacteria bacterium]|nr:purine-binding chemotaxis protein CheW [Candidatus Kapabacteria bacterium]
MEAMQNDTYTENSIETRQIVSFRLGTEEFGIDIMSIQEINRISTITRVPHAQTYVVGVINLRGKIVPVIDLRMRMGMPPSQIGEHSRIIVAEIGGKVV